MQPTFLPWLGWFDLLDQSDVAIMLDDVAFSKQSWQQRNRIRTAEGLHYLSLPVKTSGLLGQLIMDTEVAGQKFVKKMVKTIAFSYAKAPFFHHYYDSFCATFRGVAETGQLLEINMALIHWIMAQLGMDQELLMASDLDQGGKKSDHVVRLCQQVEGSHYLSPLGAQAYLQSDRALFDQAGVAVEIHNYQHPHYPQCFEPFIPYASILDLLMNRGEASLETIRSGRGENRTLAAGE